MSIALFFVAACGGGTEPSTTGYYLKPAPNLASLSMPDASQGGETAALQARPGGFMILFLGFTSCPDICPASMANIGLAVQRTEARSVDVAMVTLDPETDSPEVLTAYVQQFVPTGKALRPNTTSELDRLVERLGASYDIAEHGDHGSSTTSPDATTNREIGHTSFAYVIDDAGTVSLVWTGDMGADQMARDLEILSERLYG